ncbi:MAG: PilZ domain-containing protein [Deltaproteobacteria bacterium]|nr:PilZ domain-containing protein [Deltaproteobacteria bacterium]
MRVPARGFAVIRSETGHSETARAPLHGSLENLSETGALVHLSAKPTGSLPQDALDLELRLPEGDGWVTARAVRVERIGPRAGWHLAVVFDRLPVMMRTAIESSIEHAVSAAERRAVVVIDDQVERRNSLIERLVHGGLTPLAPQTPLEAIELLSRSQLHISVCLLAPGFGVASSTDLAAILSESFPWVTTMQITDDLDITTARALAAWAATPVARISAAIG